MKPDEFQHFCSILAEFDVSRQEAFEDAWNNGDVAQMTALCEEHIDQA